MRRDLVALCAGIVAVSIYIYSNRTRRTDKPASSEFVIDPAIYTAAKRALPLIEAPRQKITEYPIERAPHELAGFGHDITRNNDGGSVDDYLNLPLVGSGLTFENKEAYQEVDDEVGAPTYRDVKRHKFIRLSIMEANSDDVHIGGIDFLKGGRSIGDVSLWNPHTGERGAYSKGPFSDRDQLVFIFCFKVPIIFDTYRIKTSIEGVQCDPTEWMLEGSMNGNYWTPVDRRSNVEFPPLRGVWTAYSIVS